MPLTFLNGGAPDYLGFNFTNSTDLLTEIHTTLLAAGLTSITNTPATGLIELNILALDNSDSHAIRFETNINQNVLELIVTLSYDSTFTTNSPAYKLFAENNQSNRLWLTCNSDHLVMCIQEFSGLCHGLHAGYLLRLDANDTYAFVIGIPCTSAYKLDAFNGQAPQSHRFNYTIAKSFHTNSTDWFAPATYFWRNNSESGGSYPDLSQGPYFGCGFMNRHANTILAFGSAVSNSSQNAGRNNHIGNSNGLNNKTILGEYYAIEGSDTGNQQSYTLNEPGKALGEKLYFRGVVQNVVVGMSHLLGGIQIEDEIGQRFISTGGLTYCGIRIL